MTPPTDTTDQEPMWSLIGQMPLSFFVDHVPLSFSGSSDDRLHLAIPNGYAARVNVDLPDDEPDLAESDALRYGGWVVTTPEDGSFAVWAHYNGTWSFGVGHYGDENNPNWKYRQVLSVARQSPTCSYSLELTVFAPAGSTVSLIPLEEDQWIPLEEDQ